MELGGMEMGAGGEKTSGIATATEPLAVILSQ